MYKVLCTRLRNHQSKNRVSHVKLECNYYTVKTWIWFQWTWNACVYDPGRRTNVYFHCTEIPHEQRLNANVCGVWFYNPCNVMNIASCNKWLSLSRVFAISQLVNNLAYAIHEKVPKVLSACENRQIKICLRTGSAWLEKRWEKSSKSMLYLARASTNYYIVL